MKNILVSPLNQDMELESGGTTLGWGEGYAGSEEMGEEEGKRGAKVGRGGGMGQDEKVVRERESKRKRRERRRRKGK